MRKGYDKEQKRNGKTKSYIFGSLTLAGLLAVMGLVSPNAHAVDCTDSGSSSASCDTIVNLILPSFISISGSPSVYFDGGNDLTPGVFYTSGATVYVTTNSANGYTLSMQMSENQISGSTNTLYYNSSEYIPSITSVQKQSDIESDPTTGGWGFALDATNYRPLPTVNGSTYNTLNLKRTHGVANNDATTLTFGVLPPTGIQNGLYQNIITVTATANDAITLTGLNISGTPTKTSYQDGDRFDPDGLTVYAVYSDGVQVLLTDTQYVITNGNPLAGGQTSVKIRYTDNGSTVDSTVNGITVSGGSPKGSSGDNGGGSGTKGVTAAPSNTSARGVSSGSGVASTNTADDTDTSSDSGSGKADPQGVSDSYGSSSSTSRIGEDNTSLAIVLGIATATAATGIVLLAAAKRRREEEEEEEDGSGDITQMG
ncbi:bacterial Ig-like domain-containing protein [Candidatus Saccharibacteria bacterium]|nr:bacterial Ig-like domain-containing protein [Candidatus Saccharibacteria bacterium]